MVLSEVQYGTVLGLPIILQGMLYIEKLVYYTFACWLVTYSLIVKSLITSDEE